MRADTTGLSDGSAILRRIRGFHRPHRPAARSPLFNEGRAGVSFFFILSGLVLAWVWQPGNGFYRRRFARIYPAYVVGLIAGCRSRPSSLLTLPMIAAGKG